MVNCNGDAGSRRNHHMRSDRYGAKPGTYCSPRCLDVLRRYDGITSLRTYPSESNTDLIETIARTHGVSAENVVVDNGSGPILKSVIPFLIERNIKSSALRMTRYLLKRTAYPILTPQFTYSKVPIGGLLHGLRCEMLPLNLETGFSLNLTDMKSRLHDNDGLVYLANPNNQPETSLSPRSSFAHFCWNSQTRGSSSTRPIWTMCRKESSCRPLAWLPNTTI